MAAIEAPEKVGIKPFDELSGVAQVWPRGERLEALREAAARFRQRFATSENRVRAVKTVDLAAAGYPTKFALAGAAKGLNPFINIINRLVIVQFEDFEGQLRTLAWEPTIAEGAAEAPFYDQLLKRYGEFLSYKVFASFYNTVEEAVAKCGIAPSDVDVWISSENGVCADSWQPSLSKIPGVRKYAEWWNREVILNSNTLEDSLDQYDSMVKEKCLADSSARDPRWLNVFPSSEMASFRRQWPVVPTFVHGGVNCVPVALQAALAEPSRRQLHDEGGGSAKTVVLPTRGGARIRRYVVQGQPAEPGETAFDADVAA